MSLPPKNTGDELAAVEYNTVQALAEQALRPTNNLSELASPTTARTNLGLAAVAASGDYDDLASAPVINDGSLDFAILDKFRQILFGIGSDGLITLARLVALSVAGDLTGPDYTLVESADGGFAIEDKHRNILFAIGVNGVSIGIAPGTGSGGTTVTATGTTTARTLADEHAISLHAKQFGAEGDGVGNDTTEVTALHDAAVARGDRYAYLNTGTYSVSSLALVWNAIFTGQGALTGSYRKHVAPPHAPAAPPPVSGVRPAVHLTHALAAGSSVKVVFLGDSTTTINANQNAQSEYITPLIRAKFLADNPGKAFTFVNLAIASTTWDDLDGIPGAGPLSFVSGLWYTDTGKDWLDYAKDEAPDVLVFNFGMNYSPFTVSKFRSIMTKIAGWAKQPDKIFVTNQNATMMSGSYPTQAQQEGRDAVAHFVRTHAMKGGGGLIDVNRQFVKLRDGIDLLNQPIKTVATNAAVTSGSYTFASECRDFALDFTLGNATTFWAAATTMEIQIGSRTGNTLVIDKDGSGNLAVTVKADTGQDSIARAVTAIPASTTVFKMFVKGGHLFLGSSGYITLIDALVERHGGLFTPRIRSLDGGGSLVATSYTVVNAGVGEPFKFMPVVVDSDFYGGTVYGGSTANHPSSIAAQLVLAPVVEATNLCIAEAG